MTKAKDLQVGDEFSMRVACRVLAVEPAETGEMWTGVKVLLLETRSTLFGYGDDVVKFWCRPSREFATARESEERWKERLAELDALDAAEQGSGGG